MLHIIKILFDIQLFFVQNCDHREVDFRQMQCSEYDNMPFQKRYYKWVPFTKGKKVQPCALACKPDNNAWYSELAPQVVDGTRCYDDGEVLDVCIRGKCHVSFGELLLTEIYEY